MSHLSLLIKPASSLCNLRCKYCFYHDVSQTRNVFSHGIMTNETMQILIDKAFDYANESIAFMFQGGEPSLAGVEYFKNFTEYVKKKNTKNIKIAYSLQTNGINISEEFAELLYNNNFLAGLSLDGVKETNDFLRGEDTYKKIIKTANLFERKKVEFNILCVVSSYVAKHIEKTYNFFKKSGFQYLQFIPCLDPLDEKPFDSPHSLTPAIYEYFLKTLFKLWYDDFMTGEYISIRFFDNLVRMYASMPSEQCGMNGTCGDGQFVVEADGSVYPCDFYCVDVWKLGNINALSVEEIKNSANMKKFVETSYFDTQKCEKCECFYLCKGGCRRNRDLTSNGKALDNIYCETLYNFYKYAELMLKSVVQRLSHTQLQ